MTCDEAIANRIEEFNILALLLQLSCCGTVSFRPAFVHVPNYELVAITNATKRDEIRLIAREGKRLDRFIMVPDSV